jgi:hypothetical protein
MNRLKLKPAADGDSVAKQMTVVTEKLFCGVGMSFLDPQEKGGDP